MAFLYRHSYLLGKGIKKAMRLRGGGSALPGLVVESLDPKFLSRTLSQLPYGVVVVSGTNGKTTTTKMVAELLRAQGLKVFTNPSGSNFTRGVVASLIDHINPDGSLPADMAVLELDEAHAVHFVRQVKPRYTLILNVLRDQLDRFGEIDHTAKLLQQVVNATSRGVVLNREDELVRTLGQNQPRDKKVQYFGLSDTLRAQFPSDAYLHGGETAPQKVPFPHRDDVILERIDTHTAVFSFGDKPQPPLTLKIDGIYNLLNAAAALALARMVCDADTATSKDMLHTLATVRPAFGRGEAVAIDDAPLEIVLVKNPSGFRLALTSYDKTPAATMIAINDNYADGRDMSWLWDVDFTSLQKKGVAMVSGTRAYDMALRLQYDKVDVSQVDTNLTKALTAFIQSTSGRRRLYCTYTCMLTLRRELGKVYPLEAIE